MRIALFVAVIAAATAVIAGVLIFARPPAPVCVADISHAPNVLGCETYLKETSK